MLEREKNTAFYVREEVLIDETTGEILSSTKKTIAKVSAEPDFIKVYYDTMLACNQIFDVPTSFVLSLSKFLEWTNDREPQCTIINKYIKETLSKDCGVDVRQIERYIKKSVDTGLLFRTKYRGVYEVNPFMIAKGKWDSIRALRTNFEFISGKWQRTIEYENKQKLEQGEQQNNGETETNPNF